MAGTTRAWRCTVCGYVHQGDEAPEACPVCGAPQDLFELIPDAPAAEVSLGAGQWRCLVCGYIHVGPQPPGVCPACGASADCFAVVEAPKAAPVPSTDPRHGGPRKVVVVGAGIAGLAAVESLRNAAPQAEITLVSKDPDLPYYRLNLTRYLAGEITAQDLPIHDAAWYEQQHVRLLLGDEVTAIRLEEHLVELAGGQKCSFDKLLLASGANPFLPALPGIDRAGVTALRTSADARHILAACRAGAACVCIGGGLLGLETAGALARQGADVTLLEGCDWLLPRQLNARAGEILQAFVLAAGIKLRTAARTREIVGDEHVRGVLLEDGSLIPAELVIVATGVRPQCDLARRAGLEVNRGVVVNDRLEASHADVFAAGDVTEHRGQLYGIWGPAQYQGTIAGRNLAGGQVEFAGVPPSNILKVLGLDLFSIGRIAPDGAAGTALDDEADGRYCRFVFQEGHMVGAVLLGHSGLGPRVTKAIEGRRDFSALLAGHGTAAAIAEVLGRGMRLERL